MIKFPAIWTRYHNDSPDKVFFTSVYPGNYRIFRNQYRRSAAKLRNLTWKPLLPDYDLRPNPTCQSMQERL